jgi:zinc transport system ATP-binding protein
LVGPNGGGKSTLIKLLAGLIYPEDGSILRTGTIGYVSQAPGFDVLFPITVRELVLMGTLSRDILPFSRYTSRQRARALDAIDRVGLAGFESRGIDQLSGGQLKRALIARALAADVDIIALDEPDASLDIDAAGDLYHMLDELKADRTIIIASHHIDAILDIADSAVYVNKTAKTYPSPMRLKEELKGGLVL